MSDLPADVAINCWVGCHTVYAYIHSAVEQSAVVLQHKVTVIVLIDITHKLLAGIDIFCLPEVSALCTEQKVDSTCTDDVNKVNI